MAQRWVIANWKMHGRLSTNQTLLSELQNKLSGFDFQKVGISICAPFPYLFQMQQILTKTSFVYGAQNVNENESGAFTGEVSTMMLTDFGCKQVIVGHSERRHIFKESDELVAKKTLRALDAGLTPVVCVGERLDEREANQTFEVVGRQTRAVINQLEEDQLQKCIFAYEPVWAIGTGKTATTEEAVPVHEMLRDLLKSRYNSASRVPLLYGGSVKPGNAQELFSQPNIDGGLIGGASLLADDFVAVCIAASNADSAPSR